MRVFLTGASGAIGSRLVPQLIDAGHDVVGAHHAPASAERLRKHGATPVQVDLLDARAVREAVLASGPEAIVHQATALATATFGRNIDKALGPTSELRTRGTDALLAAAQEAGVGRFVAQSAAFYRYAREGGPVKTEDDPLDPSPPRTIRRTVAALDYLDEQVTGFGGIALRYGAFYGDTDDGWAELVRKRLFPIVGDGGGVFSFVHLEDAAAAVVRALEHDGPGIYNVVDDEPAPMREWLPPARPGAGGTAAAALPDLARASRGRQRRGRDGHRGPRRLQREGEAGARLDAALPDLAHRLPGRLLGAAGRRRCPLPPRSRPRGTLTVVPCPRWGSPGRKMRPRPHRGRRSRRRPCGATDETRAEEEPRWVERSCAA